ncbi:MAG: hypothetical protein AAGI17_07500 [Planctomycetota bacterium]
MSIRGTSAAIAVMGLAGAASAQFFVGAGTAQTAGQRGVSAGEASIFSVQYDSQFLTAANELFPGAQILPGLANADSGFDFDTSSGAVANGIGSLFNSNPFNPLGNVLALENRGTGLEPGSGTSVEGDVSALTFNINTNTVIAINRSGKMFFVPVGITGTSGVGGPAYDIAGPAVAAAQLDVGGIVAGAAFNPFSSVGYGVYITDTLELGFFTFGPSQSAFADLGLLGLDTDGSAIVASQFDAGLAFDPFSQTLGLSVVRDDLSTDFYSIDIDTLAATLVFNGVEGNVGGLAPISGVPAPAAAMAFAGAGLVAGRRRR